MNTKEWIVCIEGISLVDASEIPIVRLSLAYEMSCGKGLSFMRASKIWVYGDMAMERP